MSPFAKHCAVVQPVAPSRPRRRFLGMDVAIAFPPKHGYNGACTTLADVGRHGLFPGNLGLTPTKKDAVRLIVGANMQRAEADGHGNEAARRARSVMDQHRLDAEGEKQSEGRAWPSRVNPHDD